jgi:uncharacterized protein (TIGR00251 family)
MTSPTRLSVYVQTRASRTEIAGQRGADLKIRVAAAPVKNAANEELVNFIAEQLAIPKRNIRILTGLASRRKTLEIEGARAEAVAALRSLAAPAASSQQRMPSHRTAKRKVSDPQ